MTTAPPLGQALILCDFAYRDPQSGKFTLLGTFSTLATLELPAKHPKLSVFFAVTGLHGKTPIQIRCVWLNPDEDEELEAWASPTMFFNCVDPLAIVEGAMEVGNPIFPEAGTYRVELVSGTESILSRRMLVVHHTRPPQG